MTKKPGLSGEDKASPGGVELAGRLEQTRTAHALCLGAMGLGGCYLQRSSGSLVSFKAPRLGYDGLQPGRSTPSSIPHLATSVWPGITFSSALSSKGTALSLHCGTFPPHSCCLAAIVGRGGMAIRDVANTAHHIIRGTPMKRCPNEVVSLLATHCATLAQPETM